MLAKKSLMVGICILLISSLAFADPPAVHPVTGEELVIECLRGTPAAIDGDLSDWNLEAMTPAVLDAVEQLHSGQDSWTTPEDCSGEFYLLWDDVNIYIAVVAKDDVLSMNKVDGSIWNADAVEIFFATTNAVPPHDEHYQYGFNANNQKWNWCNMEGAGNVEPDYLQVATTLTADGYVCEVAIPYAQMPSLDWSVGSIIGLHPVFDDTDNGDRELQMTWTGREAHDQSLGFGHMILSDTPAAAGVTASLNGLSDVTVVDGLIESLRYEGTEYVVADGDLALGTTTRWYVLLGVELLWGEGEAAPAATVSGTSSPKDGDVGSKADNFNFTLDGSTNISSIDGIDFQETIFPVLSDTFFVFERGGNDVGSFQAILADGTLGDPVEFVKASDGGPYADTGVSANGQPAHGVVFKTSEPVKGVRITASGHDTLSISIPAPPAPVAAFAFGSRDLERPTYNNPTINYTMVLHESPEAVEYDPNRGYGYEVIYPTDSPFGDRSGYGIFGPFDDSPNNRNEFPDDGQEELYDSFIGAKNFTNEVSAATMGDMNTPSPNPEGIIFRVDVPNGLYRFVGAFGEADNGHAHRIVAEDGGSGPPENIGANHVVLVHNHDQSQYDIGEIEGDEPGDAVFARVGFDGKIPPPGDGVVPSPVFVDMDENGMPTDAGANSPVLEVTQGYIRIHQLQGNSNDSPSNTRDANGGDAVILELWKIGPANLLANGGFEDGVPDPWSTYGDASLEVVQEDPVEGDYCLHVTVNSAGANFWDAGLQHGGHVFEAGKSYTLSAYLKAKEGTMDINFKPELAADPWTGYGSQAFTMTDTWAEYTVNTGVIPENVDPASITFHIAYTAGEFFVDDVRFTEDE